MVPEKNKIFRARFISITVFIMGLLMFAGSGSYKDFYLDITSRYSGQKVDFQSLGEFCGWTGNQLPGESDWGYAFRTFWNMASAMLGMTAISFIAFGVVFGIIFLGFYWSGAFK